MHIFAYLVSPEGHVGESIFFEKTFTKRFLPALELRKLLYLSEDTATVDVHG